MNRYLLEDTIGYLDAGVLAEHLKIKEEKQRAKRRRNIGWATAIIAACFCFAVVGIPVLINIFGGANAEAPASVTYYTAADMKNALGKNTLYSDEILLSDGGSIGSIMISYKSDDAGEPITERPLQVRIDQRCAGYNVRYYIILNRDSVNDSYIGGYVEQGLSLTVNGTDVYYCSYYNGKFYEGQAKFVYDGDLYVINVFSEGKEVDVGKIAERLLSADAK